MSPFIMAHEYHLDQLTAIPKHVRDLIDLYTSAYSEGRVIGGPLSPELQEAGRVLVNVASDYAALAQKELDAISPEERAETWRQVKRLRRLEEQAHTKGANQ